MIGVAARIEQLNQRINSACERANRSRSEITLIAATKSVLVADILRAYAAGIRNFGENRVQEAESKIAQLLPLVPKPVWHMVGRLQTNKAKKAAEIFDVIHSVDSIRLAETLDRLTPKSLPVLLQVNVSGEATKTGFTPEGVTEALRAISSLSRLHVEGLTTIAPATGDLDVVRRTFRQLRLLRDKLGLKHLSMGMSNDFEIAIEEGATFIRIGRAIFGERTK